MRNRATTTLTNPKIRQSWSKYNLFNLTRMRTPQTSFRTHFQQKFKAKSIARAYHGEQVRESQWQRMFSSRIRSVIPMDPYNLAKDDGAGAAAGRGSGLGNKISRAELSVQQAKQYIPFSQMTFAPLERRLDVAVFRALFASSTRQARQFVIHGAVTVNGQKMRYPGYLLNPGDLFQVDPERVMFATGAPKNKSERREGRALRKKKSEGEEATEAEAKEEDSAAAEESKEPAEAEAKDQPKEDPRKVLKGLMAQAKGIMSTGQDVLPAKRKQELRGFQKAVRRVLSRSASSTVLTDNLESQFAELTQLLKAKRAEKKKGDRKEGKEARSPKSEASDAQKQPGAPQGAAAADEAQPGEALTEAFRQAAENPEQEPDTSELSDEEFDVLKRAMVQMRDNPIDHSKPYGTPWQPRDFMSAFAFVPRYLEVNHSICAAVYLRHPVARPGASEVPSPFGEVVGTGAFAWYLRRR
ncbi:alpha-L RNA-binding motif-containing protein [Aspergillus campestris IBT 28561]|uniref:Small ribosomal subunit protein uS4m n=1 Tax=Aspergillus campestris (strain IBT 28561) TaxID=1392248 RepID=A0A2I1CY05_ASPC2|nr:alpha-L RNA-binding motif-containing protein [Aspergillus campestris IBT 28561]PKY02482.1 alpha-L RNA-binding motif-containing protein [Aspergillus campestris IBT 28561]